MTKTPYRPSNSSENRNSNPNLRPASLPQSSALSAEKQTENSNLIPSESVVEVEAEVQPMNSAATQSLGLKAKTTILAKELSVLRSNIDRRVNQLQALIEKEGAAAERAQLINQITSRMRESLNIEDIFKTVVEDARTALQSDRVIVYQFDENWKGTVIAESVDVDWPIALGAQIADPCFAERYVEFYQKGRVKATANIYEAGLTDCHLRQLEPFAVQANLVAPILAKTTENPTGHLYGLLIAHQCSEPRLWMEPEVEFMRQLAIQLGYAIDQALLLQKQREATRMAQRLNQINAGLRKSLNVEDILTAAVEETREALKSDRVVVYEFDANWKGTVIAESVDNKWPIALGAKIADPCFAERYVQPYLRGRVKATENIHKAGLTECYLGQLERFAVQANLVAPLLVNNKLMGLLITHQCSGPRVWTELEIDLMRNVAVQVGYALDQAYLLQEQLAAAQKAKLLNEITARLRNTPNREEVFDTIVEEARGALKADRAIIYQFDEDWIGTVVAESVDKRWPGTMGQKIADPCFAGEYVKPYLRGRISSMSNIYESGLTDCYIKLLEPFGVKANIVAPIIAETRLHGLLIVHQCSGPRKWGESDINFVKQLATQLSLALDQVLLLQQQQQAAEQARRLNQISSHIRESLNPKDIFNTTVEDTQEALKSDRVVVYQFDANWVGTVVAESVSVGFPEALGAKINDPCFAQNYVKPYLKGRVQATENIYEAGLTDCHIGQLEPFGVKANLVAPIVSNQKLHGLLIAHQCSGARKWKSTEIDFFRQIAIQVGYALDQAFLLEQQRAATQQARKLSEISSRIRQSLNLDQIFRTSVEESLSLMQADRVVVYRFDEKWHGEIAYESVKPGWLKIIEMETDVPCFPAEYVEPYRKGRIQVTEDIAIAELSPCHKEQLQKWQVKANVVVPILVEQKLYGLLGAHQCFSKRQWTASEVEVFKQVALQVGYALEQAQLLEEIQQARQSAEKASYEQQKQNEMLQHQIEDFLGDIEESFNGDLTVRARVSEGVMGTVADFFNATIENLQRLVLQVQSAATVVAQTAQGSEKDIKQLSNEALRQAETIADALTQIQVMANSIQAVAQNAQSAEMKVQQASQILQTSDQAMNRTVEGIMVIQKTVHATARKVKNLGEASKKISRVVSLIGEFANQTNVLALNASVEATRASQDDQGFATVATEVRTLAEQSASASAEIEQIVEEIQAETNEVIRAMQVGMKRVLLGTNLVKDTRQTLTDLVEVSRSIRELVEQIAGSATAQAQTSGQLSGTMQEVAAIARSTSEQSLTVADSFTQLLGVAGELQKGVAQFTVNE
ncbi:GAF domain-containing protein [Limnoraphis robusta]|uniref:GAF domain-containing protein n=1 Tax=Limnoraphis robusta CCNP1315 TaxID=3110306 RepID=A0ABU5TV81_9CYAN|nr:GAF domain-containing protein [Limnoraphis robusta]MEA5518719.1 GAF domain-containing protein [Limnoraphis robusta CCNP1315]MEA5544960.1 GAF domain-containing protein [Limnoraphis robusta CCNP1324]